MMDALVEQLRKASGVGQWTRAMLTAADTIEALRAENARLKEDAARYQFIRRCLELKNQQTVSGRIRLGIAVRIGLSFLDAPNKRGASEQSMKALDDAIDDALATKEKS